MSILLAGLASVRGSYMFYWYDPTSHQNTVTCLEGNCAYTNSAGTVEMTSGQKIVSSDPNTLPAIQKMDQADVQNWLDNVPEAAAIVPQILTLLASSTPSLTPTITTNPATGTPTATPSPSSTLNTFADQYGYHHTYFAHLNTPPHCNGSSDLYSNCNSDPGAYPNYYPHAAAD